MRQLPRFGAGLGSWFSYGLVALGASACTALLGDFEIASGSGGGTLDGGADASESPGGEEPPMVSPETIKVGVERPVAFNASGPVMWSVLEPNGGSIDATGHYRSPPVPGDYHVVATSTANPALKTQVTVNVVDLQLEVIAGPAAGQGTVDGLLVHAHFNRPEAIAYAPSRGGTPRRYFIADTGSHTIRMASGNTVTTLAGSPGDEGSANGAGAAARFSRPSGVEFASKSSLVLVADTDNHCIRAIDPASGETTLFAGVCGSRGSGDGDASTGRLDSPGALVLTDDESKLYVCSKVNGGLMRIVDMSTRAIASLASPTMNNGCSLGVIEWNGGQKNRLFFGGASDGLLRSLLTTDAVPAVSTWSTLPDGHIDGFASDTGFGAGAGLYVSAANKHAIYESEFSAGNPTSFQLLVGDPAQTNDAARNGSFAQAKLGRPRGLLLRDGDSKMQLVDEAASAIRAVDFNAQTVTDFIGKTIEYGHLDAARSAARFALVTGVTVGPDVAYVSDASSDGGRISGTIRAVNLSSGAVTTIAGQVGRFPAAEDGPKSSAKFVFPFDLVKEGELLYVVDVLAHAVRKVTIADGQVSTLAGSLNADGDSLGTGIAAQFKNPGGIAADGAGNLYVSDTGNFKIKKIALATGTVTLLAGSSEGSADGPAASAQFRAPSGLTVVGDSLFVADGADHTIRRVNLASGEVSTLVGLHQQPGFVDGGPAVAKLFGPSRLAPDGIGGLYVTEGVAGFELDKGVSGTIRRIDITTRTVRPFFGKFRDTGLVPGPLANARANLPLGLATTPAGDLVFTDLNDYSVGFIKPL